MNLKLITTEKFGDLNCNFYRNLNDDILLTREQVGQALEYAKPSKAIQSIHLKHKDRLEPLCLRIKLGHPQSEGNLTKSEEQEQVYYTERGIMEICRWSRQSKANIFMDWVWDIVERYRHNELSSSALQQVTVNLSAITASLQTIITQNQSLNDRIISLLERNSAGRTKRGFSYWTKKMNRKYEALMDHYDITRKQLYHNLFIEFTNYYPDIDLNQETEDYCYENNVNNCYTLDVIEAKKPLRAAFENMVDNILAENNITVETEQTITPTIFTHAI